MPAWLARLITPEQKRFLQFAIVGGSGVVVNLVVVLIATQWVFAGLASETMVTNYALVAGIVVSIFTNFIVNDRWTWGDREKGGRKIDWARRCRDFYIASAVAGGVQLLVSSTFVRFVQIDATFILEGPALTAGLASLVGIAIATPINYVVNHFWTFRERADADAEPEE